MRYFRLIAGLHQGPDYSKEPSVRINRDTGEETPKWPSRLYQPGEIVPDMTDLAERLGGNKFREIPESQLKSKMKGKGKKGKETLAVETASGEDLDRLRELDAPPPAKKGTKASTRPDLADRKRQPVDQPGTLSGKDPIVMDQEEREQEESEGEDEDTPPEPAEDRMTIKPEKVGQGDEEEADEEEPEQSESEGDEESPDQKFTTEQLKKKSTIELLQLAKQRGVEVKQGTKRGELIKKIADE